MKYQTTYFLYTLIIAALSLVSCDKNDDHEIAVKGDAIVFKFGIDSSSESPFRTASPSDGTDFSTSFAEGDAVGIFAVKRTSGASLILQSDGNYFHNEKLTYSANGGGTWTSQQPLYYPNDGDVLDFYAYYPFDEAATNPTDITFNVKLDQNVMANYASSDLLVAAPALGIAKGDEVNLTFAHKMAMVQVEVNPSDIDGSAPPLLMLHGCVGATTVNLASQTIGTASGEADDIKMWRVETSGTSTAYTYRALVPGQTIMPGTTLCLIGKDEQKYTSPALEIPFTLVAGKAERFGISLPSQNPIDIEKVWIPAGTFLMGSSDGSNIGNGTGSGLDTTPGEPSRNNDEPQHHVTLTKGFYMGKYPITNAQYVMFLNAKNIGANGDGLVSYDDKIDETQNFIFHDEFSLPVVKYDNGSWVVETDYENHPIVYVSWYGAKAFADWIGGSLPTEAQWEYACRGGKENHPFGIGDGYTMDNTFANFDWVLSWYWDGSSQDAVLTHKGPYPGKIQPVGSYPHANGYGLYDMHGNVNEWCSDRYDDKYVEANATDPTGPATGFGRVLRGGCWYSGGFACRSAYRDGSNPIRTDDAVGFRIVFNQ